MEKPNETKLHEIKLLAAMASILKVAELIEETDDFASLGPLPRSMVHLVGLASVITEVPEHERKMVLNGCVDGLSFLVEAFEHKLRKGTVQ